MSFKYFLDSLMGVSDFVGAIFAILTVLYSTFRFGRAYGTRLSFKKSTELASLNAALASENARLKGRVDHIDDIIGGKEDFWSRTPAAPFDLNTHCGEISRSIPIISILNFKGGVGKTTVCANVAGYFARAGKRVLLIDFDYQGSLSNTVLTHARVEQFAPTSHKLIERQERPDQLRQYAERLTSLSSNLWIYPAFYELSRSEIKVMFRWLAGLETDIRFNLHHYLQSLAFQSDPERAFDIVLIDCPPRFLTTSVNALAASTHVLVPTILDGQSHEATLNTLNVIQRFRQNLNPKLKTIGVLPSMVESATGFNAREQRVIEELEKQMVHFHDPVPVLRDCRIVRKEQLAQAGGSEVVYFSSSNNQATQDIRVMFSSLAEYIEQKVEWRAANTARIIDFQGNYDEDRRVAARS